MKKTLIICLYLAVQFCTPLFIKAQNTAQEVITSLKLGDQNISITREGEDPDFSYLVKLDNRTVAAINNRFVDLEGYFNLIDFNKIVVLSSADGGNACPKELLIIAFNDSGLVTVTQEFGNCHEAPTYIATSDSLKIDFPFGNNPVAESWIYDKKGLRQIKKTLVKRKR